MSDALPFVGVDADTAEQLPALLALTLLLGAVNPDAIYADGLCGKHEIAHDEAAVIDAVAPISLLQDHDDGGSTIEGVGLRAEQSGSATARAGAQIAARAESYLRILKAHAVGSIFSTLNDGGYLLISGHTVGVKAAHGAARKDVGKSLVHFSESFTFLRV